MLSVLVPIAFYVVYRTKQSQYIHLLGVLLVLSGVIDGISFVLIQLRINPNYSSNTYPIILFFSLSLIYYRLFSGRYSKLLLIAGAGFTVMVAYEIVTEGASASTSMLPVVSSLIFIGYSILYFYRLLKDLPAQRLSSLPGFWINVSVLFYFSGTFILFLSFTYLIEKSRSNDTLMAFWSIQNISNIIRNILYAIAIYTGSRQQELSAA